MNDQYFISFITMEQDFTIAEIIDLMKKTKKTDPLFKPLKKIKTALQSIGIANVSFAPTCRVLAFHFGLGNELDKQFLKLTQPHHLVDGVQIIPGSSYCILQFQSNEHSSAYLSSKHKMEDKPVFFQEITYQNLSRTLVFLFCKEEFLKNTQIFTINNCGSSYKPQSIPGLIIVEDIVSKDEELQLLQNIDKGKWDRLNNRRVQHHGYSFKYGRNQIDKDQQQGQLPQYFTKLLQKLKQIQILKHSQFDQLTINDYFAGNGIPSHFDTHSPFEQIFISISLLSGIVMDFRKYDGDEHSIFLKERSLAVFSGEARYAWTHGICGRKVDKIDNKIAYRSRRISLTFRQIKFTPCTCPYYFYCDSQGYNQQTMKKNNPLLTKYLAQQASSLLSKYSSRQIEKEFVQKAYNGFGFDFHNKVIEQVKIFLEKELQVGDFVLDIGCGNGEYLKYIKQGVYYTGIQKCTIMVPVDNQLHMDCLKLGFKDGAFDAVMMVAVLHHLASQQSRVRALKEVNRVLRLKGMLYLSVLNYENKRQVYSSPQILLQYCLPANKLEEKSAIITNQENKNGMMKGQETQTPRIQQRGQVYKRYYHLFTKGELVSLLQRANFEIAEIFQSKQNIIVKAFKRQD